MEFLDIVDEKGIPTGEIVDRMRAHAEGIRHRTSHVWIVRQKEGRLQILLQKRSEEKDSYPGCYDISSAGHIPAGVDFIPSAIRELKEELGYDAEPGQLIYCGQRRIRFDAVFHGKPFHDNQVSNVYAIWLDREPEAFVLQKEEVSEVRWFDFEDCVEKVASNRIPHCIVLEELEMVRRALFLQNLNRLHTTELGAARILKNLSLNTDDVVRWCVDQIQREDALISRKGKNWYVVVDGCEITINANNYTIITAHVVKGA